MRENKTVISDQEVKESASLSPNCFCQELGSSCKVVAVSEALMRKIFVENTFMQMVHIMDG